MIKMRAPSHISSLSGYEIGRDGSVIVDEQHAAHLREAFGFTHFDADEASLALGGALRQQAFDAGVSSLNRHLDRLSDEELEAFVKNMPLMEDPDGRDPRRRSVIARMSLLSTEELEALLELARGGEDVAESEIGDVSAVTVEQIDAMKRNDLFAFLRAKNISAPTPITNDELRAKAKAAL